MGSVYKRVDRGGKRAGKYYVQYRDHDGKVRTKATGTSDKVAKHLSNDITEQLDAYRRRLETAGKSDPISLAGHLWIHPLTC